MSTKQAFLNEWKRINLSELGLSKSVFFKGLTEAAQKRILETFEFKTEEEAEEEYFFVGHDVEEEDIADWSQYSEEWFEDHFYDGLAYFFEQVFKREYPHYLYHSVGSDWMGRSHYGFYSKDDLLKGRFLAEYENTTHLENYYNGKILELKEYHHDVPLGHPVYLIGLTKNQYQRLMNYHQSGDREEIRAFAEKMIASEA